MLRIMTKDDVRPGVVVAAPDKIRIGIIVDEEFFARNVDVGLFHEFLREMKKGRGIYPVMLMGKMNDIRKMPIGCHSSRGPKGLDHPWVIRYACGIVGKSFVSDPETLLHICNMTQGFCGGEMAYLKSVAIDLRILGGYLRGKFVNSNNRSYRGKFIKILKEAIPLK